MYVYSKWPLQNRRIVRTDCSLADDKGDKKDGDAHPNSVAKQSAPPPMAPPVSYSEPKGELQVTSWRDSPTNWKMN